MSIVDDINDILDAVMRLEEENEELRQQLATAGNTQAYDKLLDLLEEDILWQEKHLTERTSPVAYRTAAVDPRIIPYGTEFTVDAFPGVVWIAEDCGNYWSDEVSRSGYYRHIRGNRIDLRMPDKQTCLEFGRQEVEVEVLP